jgi:hypothetical protein
MITISWKGSTNDLCPGNPAIPSKLLCKDSSNSTMTFHWFGRLCPRFNSVNHFTGLVVFPQDSCLLLQVVELILELQENKKESILFISLLHISNAVRIDSRDGTVRVEGATTSKSSY